MCLTISGQTTLLPGEGRVLAALKFGIPTLKFKVAFLATLSSGQSKAPGSGLCSP